MDSKIRKLDIINMEVEHGTLLPYYLCVTRDPDREGYDRRCIVSFGKYSGGSSFWPVLRHEDQTEVAKRIAYALKLCKGIPTQELVEMDVDGITLSKLKKEE